MNWVDHSRITRANKHAFLSPSQPHWLRYTPDKLRATYDNRLRAAHGTRLHAFAQECIELGIGLPETVGSLNAFVNDALKFKMSSEVVLYHSSQCYGTADAISFHEGVLRIHDLKTGRSAPHLEQLDIYAALFCMEYEYRPNDIDIILRVYQNNEVVEWTPPPGDIRVIMNIIEDHEYVLEELIYYER